MSEEQPGRRGCGQGKLETDGWKRKGKEREEPAPAEIPHGAAFCFLPLSIPGDLFQGRSRGRPSGDGFRGAGGMPDRIRYRWEAVPAGMPEGTGQGAIRAGKHRTEPRRTGRNHQGPDRQRRRRPKGCRSPRRRQRPQGRHGPPPATGCPSTPGWCSPPGYCEPVYCEPGPEEVGCPGCRACHFRPGSGSVSRPYSAMSAKAETEPRSRRRTGKRG